LLKTLRKLFFWNYARSSWQWDILCVVILIFIFLPPKGWFENGERRAAMRHQSPTASTLVVGAEVVEKAQDRAQLHQRTRPLTGRQSCRVLSIHNLPVMHGKKPAYEMTSGSQPF